jgi:hypothetical protein
MSRVFQSCYDESRIYPRCFQIVTTNHGYIHVVSKSLRRTTDVYTLFPNRYYESRIYTRCLKIVTTKHGYMYVVYKSLRRITDICTLFPNRYDESRIYARCLKIVTTKHGYMHVVSKSLRRVTYVTSHEMCATTEIWEACWSADGRGVGDGWEDVSRARWRPSLCKK